MVVCYLKIYLLRLSHIEDNTSMFLRIKKKIPYVVKMIIIYNEDYNNNEFSSYELSILMIYKLIN